MTAGDLITLLGLGLPVGGDFLHDDFPRAGADLGIIRSKASLEEHSIEPRIADSLNFDLEKAAGFALVLGSQALLFSGLGVLAIKNAPSLEET